MSECAQASPSVTATLIQFLYLASEEWFPPLRDQIKARIKAASHALIEKKVIVTVTEYKVDSSQIQIYFEDLFMGDASKGIPAFALVYDHIQSPQTERSKADLEALQKGFFDKN